MSTKLALVVDDSRMARFVLSKMLTEQGINVDSVESGEEALGYLCSKKPSMIFMDHTMPGMDGFQCLRAIKNDPHTSMIPIIMYTSKEGEVYESQARALGAADILPKTLKPLMLAQVLERQNLLPHQSAEIEASMAKAANDVVIVDEDNSIGKAFNEYRQEHPKAAPDTPTEEHPELEALEKRIETLTGQLQSLNDARSKGRGRFFRFQFLGLAICVALIGWLLVSNNQLMQQITLLETVKRSLADSLQLKNEELDQLHDDLDSALNSKLSQNDVLNTRFYESIEWALNEDGQFDWNESPYNDRLAATLTQLADNLSGVGFNGEIAIRSHLGRFCLQVNSNGEAALPEAGQVLSSCEVIELNPALSEQIGTAQSPGFERFLAAFEGQYQDTIELDISTAGDRRPLTRYPIPDPDMDAARWNTIAARNQRIEIAITPYSP